MIIIEGPDNSGKTTLGAKLQRDLEIPLLHSIRPPKSSDEQQVLQHSYAQLTPKRVILDRVYAISEPIYGPICRGKSDLGKLGENALMDLMSRDYLVIYCRPLDKVILKNDGRDQMEGVLENHEAIIRAYDRAFEDLCAFHSGTVVYHDWKMRLSYPSLLKIAKDHLKKFDSTLASAAFLSRF